MWLIQSEEQHIASTADVASMQIWLPDALLRSLRDHPASAYLSSCPVAGIWSVDERNVLQTFISSGGSNSMRGWADAIGASPVPGFDYLPNINRPSDLAAAHGG